MSKTAPPASSPCLQARLGPELARHERSIMMAVRESYIKPLLHGAEVSGPFKGGNEKAFPLDLTTPGKMKIWLTPKSQEYYILERPIAFSSHERAFMEHVVANLAAYRMENYLAYPPLISAAIEQAIAWSVNPDYAGTGLTVFQVLQVYTQWASETHEGKKMEHATGIYFNRHGEGATHLYMYRHNNCLKILGSTADTLLAIGKDGIVLGMELIAGDLDKDNKHQDVLAPISTAGIALWTDTCSKAAVSLTEFGDILIFKDKRLVFAKRRSFWRSFPHDLVMREAIPLSLSEDEQKSRKAVYLTALDIAMTRRGGCIGIFPGENADQQCRQLVQPGQLFDSSSPSLDTQLLASVIRGRKFYEIPRQLRAELCAVDGALVLDAEGRILTVGAIVKTDGNAATGGGRSAAAKTLARRGFGIKISSDGYIEIFDGGKPPVCLA